MLYFLDAVVQSSWGSAVHNSLSPDQVTAESDPAHVLLPLPKCSACLQRGLPLWVLKLAFHKPSAGLNSVAGGLAECDTQGQLQSLSRDRRRLPGFKQAIDPAKGREVSTLCTLAFPAMR